MCTVHTYDVSISIILIMKLSDYMFFIVLLREHCNWLMLETIRDILQLSLKQHYGGICIFFASFHSVSECNTVVNTIPRSVTYCQT